MSDAFDIAIDSNRFEAVDALARAFADVIGLPMANGAVRTWRPTRFLRDDAVSCDVVFSCKMGDVDRLVGFTIDAHDADGAKGEVVAWASLVARRIEDAHAGHGDPFNFAICAFAPASRGPGPEHVTLVRIPSIVQLPDETLASIKADLGPSFAAN